jgi:hypothetical protein
MKKSIVTAVTLSLTLTTTAQAIRPARPSADVILPQSLESVFAHAHRAAAAYEASLLGKDVFDDATMPSVQPNVQFSITGRFKHLYAMPASYEYYKGKLTLQLHASPTLRQSIIPRGSYTGQNAFGARAPVQSYFSIEDGLWFRVAPAPESTFQGLAYVLSLPLPPAKARSLVQNARVIITGSLDPSGDGSVRCTEEGEVPTLGDPTSEDFIRLWVPVRVDRIAFIDQASGSVLKEWTAMNTPMKSDFEPPDATKSSCN